MWKLLTIFLFINGLAAECCISSGEKPSTDKISLDIEVNKYNRVYVTLIWKDEFDQVLKKNNVWLTYAEAKELGCEISEENWEAYADQHSTKIQFTLDIDMKRSA